jgi:predicted ArsR family transcriptional regulator
VELAILELLERHGSLAYEQIAAHVDERPEDVRSTMTDLREAGFVDVLTLGERDGNNTRGAAYWQLTDAGREELAQWR